MCASGGGDDALYAGSAVAVVIYVVEAGDRVAAGAAFVLKLVMLELEAGLAGLNFEICPFTAYGLPYIPANP